MPIQTTSPIFNGVRADRVAGGLSRAQLDAIVGYINRSPIFDRRLSEFERDGGQIEYETTEKNYFWVNAGIPTVYLSPAYRNGAAQVPDLSELAKVIAHEMSHFETYHKQGFNPNNAADADGGGAAGSRDEARAYALEYLIEEEINRTEPRVHWTDEEQARLAAEGIATRHATTEKDRLEAAARNLLDWAANWTGPTVEAGGYFQFYKNDWLNIQDPPGAPVTVSAVAIRCDADGAICELEYTEEPGGRRVVVLDALSGKFVPRAA